MANDKGLFLPLKIDLTEWERSLTQADADLQKEMKKMRGAVGDLRLRYDVEIAGAKAAGDQLKVIELETKKLNQLYAVQRQAVDALNKAYQKSVQEKGADAQASKALAQQLIRESKQLDRLQAQMSSKGINLGKSLSDGLASVSPAFARVREMTTMVTGSLANMGTTATTAIKALGGIGIAVAGLGAIANGLDAIANGVNNIAEAGVEASDKVYQLRESMQGTYKDAEFIRGVTAVDGSNAESLVNSLTKLTGVLQKDEDGTNSATQALRKYGAEMLNADGSAKTYREQLEQLAKAAQKAAARGEFQDFKAALPGAFRSTEFDHLLLGLENYIALAEAASTKAEILYDKLHKVTDARNARQFAEENLKAVQGGLFADSAVENLKTQTDTLVATANLIDTNREKMEQFGKTVGSFSNSWTRFKGAASIAWESIKQDIAGGLIDLEKYQKYLKIIANVNPLMREIYNRFSEASTQLNSELEKVTAKRQKVEADALEKQKAKKIDTTVVDVGSKNQKKEQEKKEKETQAQLEREKAVRERFARELRDVTATEYEREINALHDKVVAYMKDGLTEVEAHELYTKQKEQIDQKYYEKEQKQRQQQVKQAEDAYKREIEAAKRAREASMSEAEQTLRNNLKLVKYIQAEQKKGTYSEDKAKQYAENLYLKQNGFNRNDISFLKDFGTEELKKIADARERLFKDFANIGKNITQPIKVESGFGYFGDRLSRDVVQQPQQQQQPQQPPTVPPVQVTVNFDNTVVEDVGTMEKLANRVADVISPAIEQALKGGNSYGY